MPNLFKLVQYGMLGWLPLGPKHCVICDNDVWGFLPYRGGASNIPPLMSALDVIGSDVENFECPRCGAHDRERHLYMYLEAVGLLATLSDVSVLHFAPEKRLSKVFTTIKPARYERCDLYPSGVDINKVDMLDMKFASETFELLIANHVLEHVLDDHQALKEVCRVLKPAGYAILQTPYSQKLHKTWQDDGILEEKERLVAYGQEDHVRLYGRDIFERICSVGLIPLTKTHAEVLSHVDPIKHGVNSAEPFMLFQKK